jgi:hypothetical protein
VEGDVDVSFAGGAIGLVLGAGIAIAAQAAELPNMKAAPTERVKKCNVGGMAGVVIPGTSTCVKIGGYVSGGVEAGDVKP